MSAQEIDKIIEKNSLVENYSIFKKYIKKNSCPNMDKIENNYLVIPMNKKISIKDAKFIAEKINNFF